MKNKLITIGFWIAAVVLIAVLIMSMGFSFPEALLIGVLFLPGVLAARYFLSKISFKSRKAGLLDALFLILAIMVAETALVVLANISIIQMRDIFLLTYEGYPKMLFNPVFIGMILTLFIVGDTALSRYLGKRFPSKQTPLHFVSDRRTISLLKDEILYIESNDTEVTVYATQGRSFRNKTGIGQWEDILGDEFLRIHRSYLVNTVHATLIAPDTVTVADARLPVSRKYKEWVCAVLQTESRAC
jgi:hypothetical protein